MPIIQSILCRCIGFACAVAGTLMCLAWTLSIAGAQPPGSSDPTSSRFAEPQPVEDDWIFTDDESEAATARSSTNAQTIPSDETTSETETDTETGDAFTGDAFTEDALPSLFIVKDTQNVFDEADANEAALDQSFDESEVQPHSLLPQQLLPQETGAKVRLDTAGEVQSLTEADDVRKSLSLQKLSQEPYSNYRIEQSSWSWLPGSGQQFGWLSFQGSTYTPRGKAFGFSGNFGMHLLGGPTSSPIPPRLYDFAVGIQARNNISDRFSYDLATSIGAYSDFEGSARDGVRFPSHAVGMVHVNETTDVVFGIDYLDRDDVAMLPVFGVSLHDSLLPGLRLDLVFPRPRIDYVLTDSWRSYLTAVMDGGTWDISIPHAPDDVMTYRDYRLILGFENADESGGLSAWEFGYAFGRELEFRHDPTSTRFDDAFVLQWVWRR